MWKDISVSFLCVQRQKGPNWDHASCVWGREKGPISLDLGHQMRSERTKDQSVLGLVSHCETWAFLEWNVKPWQGVEQGCDYTWMESLTVYRWRQLVAGGRIWQKWRSEVSWEAAHAAQVSNGGGLSQRGRSKWAEVAEFWLHFKTELTGFEIRCEKKRDQE